MPTDIPSGCAMLDNMLLDKRPFTSPDDAATLIVGIGIDPPVKVFELAPHPQSPPLNKKLIRSKAEMSTAPLTVSDAYEPPFCFLLLFLLLHALNKFASLCCPNIVLYNLHCINNLVDSSNCKRLITNRSKVGQDLNMVGYVDHHCCLSAFPTRLHDTATIVTC